MTKTKDNLKGIAEIPKIRKLAKAKGYKLTDVQFGIKKKTIRFAYETPVGSVLVFFYANREQGIRRELQRLGR